MVRGCPNEPAHNLVNAVFCDFGMVLHTHSHDIFSVFIDEFKGKVLARDGGLRAPVANFQTNKRAAHSFLNVQETDYYTAKRQETVFLS